MKLREEHGYLLRPTSGRTLWLNRPDDYLVRDLCVTQCGELGEYGLFQDERAVSICRRCRSRRREPARALKQAILDLLFDGIYGVRFLAFGNVLIKRG